MRAPYLAVAFLAGMLAGGSAATAQATNARGTDDTFLAGQIKVPNGVASLFPDIDNRTFTCSLTSFIREYVQKRAKDGDVLAAMVSSDKAFSVGREDGYPWMAVIKGADGAFRTLMPAVLKFKTAVKASEVLHSDGYDIEATRAIRAGDSIPVLYIDGTVILSAGAAEETRAGTPATPWVSVFRSNSKNRNATIGVWRIEISQLR